MYIVVTFFADDKFSHLIDTNKLKKELRDEVEAEVNAKRFSSFSGSSYFCDLQDGSVHDKSLFPLTIHGMLDVYLD